MLIVVKHNIAHIREQCLTSAVSRMIDTAVCRMTGSHGQANEQPEEKSGDRLKDSSAGPTSLASKDKIY